MGLDGAKIVFYTPRADSVSIEDESGNITRNINLIRVFTANKGYSMAAIDGAFFCDTNEIGKRYYFRTFDIEKKIASFQSVEQSKSLVLAGAPYFIKVPGDEGLPQEAFDCELKELLPESQSTCMIKYTDKYGCHVTQFSAPLGLESLEIEDPQGQAM